MEICTCSANPRNLSEEGFTVHDIPLAEGGYTHFMLHTCLDCGGLRGFPLENFLLFMRKGEPELVKGLKQKFNLEEE